MNIDDSSDMPLGDWLKSKLENNENITLEEGWNRLNKDGIQVLHEVLKGNDISKRPFSTIEYSTLYHLTYSMSGHLSHIDFSLDLYYRCKQSIEDFLVTDMVPLLTSSDIRTPVDIIQRCCHLWQVHIALTKWMWRLLMHLDQGVVVNKELMSVTSCALKSFKDIVFTIMHPIMTNQLLILIDEVRIDDQVDHCPLIKDCLELFIVMGAIDERNVSNVDKLSSLPPALTEYSKHFEQAFLEQCCRYARQKSQSLQLLTQRQGGDTRVSSESQHLDTYLCQVENLLKQELELAAKFLPTATATLSKLKAVFVFELLVAQSALLRRGTPEVVEKALQRALQHQASVCSSATNASGLSVGLSSGGGADTSNLLPLEDKTLVSLTRAFRLYSLADEMFPSSSRYLFEELDADMDVLDTLERVTRPLPDAESSMEDDEEVGGGVGRIEGSSSPPPRTGQLLQLLVDSFFSTGVKKGLHLLVVVARGGEGVEAEVEGGGTGQGSRSKRVREYSNGGVGGREGEEVNGEKVCRKRFESDNNLDQICVLHSPLNQKQEQQSDMHEEISSSFSSSSTFISPPLKRQKGLCDTNIPSSNEEKRRQSGSGRKSSSAKKLQKSRMLAEDKYVTAVLRMIKIFNALAIVVFQNKPSFIQTVKKIARDIVNTSEVTLEDCEEAIVAAISIAAPVSVPVNVTVNQIDMFVRFSDRLVNGGSDMNELESFVKLIFANIGDKDLFIEGYHRLLSRRLLRSYSQLDIENGLCFGGSSGSSGGLSLTLVLDVEKSFLSLIKQQCGNSSVVKIEGMLNDLYVSHTTNTEFQQREHHVAVVNTKGKAPERLSDDANFPREDRNYEEVEEEEQQEENEKRKREKNEQKEELKKRQEEQLPEFYVLLLTQNFWPSLTQWSWSSMKTRAVILPKPLALCQRLFTDWFRTHKGRRLKWSYAHGEVCLRMHIPISQKQCTVSRDFSSSPSTAALSTQAREQALKEPSEISSILNGAEGFNLAYDLLLVPEQAVVLCLFNNTPDNSPEASGRQMYSLAHLKEQSGLELSALRRVLHSLCSQQHRVLLKGTKGELSAAGCVFMSGEGQSSNSSTCPSSSSDAHHDDLFFAVNHSFRSRLLRCRLPMPSASSFLADNKNEGVSIFSSSLLDEALGRGQSQSTSSSVSMQEVSVARKQSVEAAIVRLLKGRKSLSESEILQAVQSRASQPSPSFLFIPDAVLVRKCLATLVEKEYIESLQSDPHQFIYCP